MGTEENVHRRLRGMRGGASDGETGQGAFEGSFRADDIGGFGGFLKPLFGATEGSVGSFYVDFVLAFGGLGEDQHVVFEDLGDPAIYGEGGLGSIGQYGRQRSDLEVGQEWRVAGQDNEDAHDAGDGDFGNVEPGRRSVKGANLQRERFPILVRHAYATPMALAFSNTSSIAPQ